MIIQGKPILPFCKRKKNSLKLKVKMKHWRISAQAINYARDSALRNWNVRSRERWRWAAKTGRRAAAAQGWSAQRHTKRPSLWHAVWSGGLWKQAGWRWGEKNQGLSGRKAKARSHVHHVDEALPSLILLRRVRCERGLCFAVVGV